jgi:hypothetical protein
VAQNMILAGFFWILTFLFYKSRDFLDQLPYSQKKMPSTTNLIVILLSLLLKNAVNCCDLYWTGWPRSDALDLYLGGVQFESCVGHWLGWQTYLPQSLQANVRIVPRVSHNHCLLNPLQVISHCTFQHHEISHKKFCDFYSSSLYIVW